MDRGITAIIPARYGSSRFPGKPLALISGKPMIQWVYERAARARSLDNLLVATDDERIADVVARFGQVVMTPSDLASGTDRVAWVAQSLDFAVVVNIQGDEPLIEPQAIDAVTEALLSDEGCDMATLARQITDPQDLESTTAAYVALDARQRALYFSRAVIPFVRDVADRREWIRHTPIYDQIGIYAYRRDFLLRFSQLPPSRLEAAERLEQLRALENGFRIKVGLVNFKPVCVDLPEHIIKVERKIGEMRNRENE
ncbi:3-deoxy-manno-octulosonate cytidylyltransferase [candidate division KSB1 bacterium]|nr:3-deoxy-manno-octulosonate cytidylyltransferase [candidate division KSB1 bacterium]